MAVIAAGAAYLLGKGLIAVADSTGLMRNVGNATDFTTNVEFEELEIFSSMTPTKTLDKTFKIATTPGFAFTMQEAGLADNMAFGLSSGTVTDVAQVGASTEALTGTPKMNKGCFTDLGKRKITAISTAGALSGLSASTDYVLYGDAGYLFIPYTSTIANDTTLDETITYSSVDYKTISMFDDATVEREIWFISVLSPFPVLKMWRCSVKVAGDLAWIGDEPILIPIEGKILDDSTNHAAPNNFGLLSMEDVV